MKTAKQLQVTVNWMQAACAWPYRPGRVEIVSGAKAVASRYTVLPLLHEEILLGFRFLRDGGGAAGREDSHDVCLVPGHEGCECKDWHYRRAGRDEAGCKHVRAIRQLMEGNRDV